MRCARCVSSLDPFLVNARRLQSQVSTRRPLAACHIHSIAVLSRARRAASQLCTVHSGLSPRGTALPALSRLSRPLYPLPNSLHVGTSLVFISISITTSSVLHSALPPAIRASLQTIAFVATDRVVCNSSCRAAAFVFCLRSHRIAQQQTMSGTLLSFPPLCECCECRDGARLR